jgi:hypothetical protein
MIGEDLKPYRRAADIIEAAGLESTIVRPAWLTGSNEVDYETTTETGLLSAVSCSLVRVRQNQSGLNLEKCS